MVFEVFAVVKRLWDWLKWLLSLPVLLVALFLVFLLGVVIKDEDENYEDC